MAIPNIPSGSFSQYTPPDAERTRQMQVMAANLGLDLNLYDQFGLNPAGFQAQYGQYQDPKTGVFKIPDVTPGTLLQNPNYANSVLNLDGTPIRAGTMPTTGTSSTGSGFALLPNYLAGVPTGIPGLNEFFNPNFGRDEQIMAGAENAIAGGWGAGGFGLNQTNRLLDSERKANILAGHQILEPYLERESRASLQASDNAARLNQIAAQGAQALQQLQLSEAGDTARLSSSQAAQLQRDVLAGQQAMQQLTLREAGDTGRQREQIGGNLANTLLSSALAGRTGGTTGPTARPGTPGNPYTAANPSGPLGPVYGTPSNVNIFNAPMASNPNARGVTSGNAFTIGSSSIDEILRKYGLLN